MQSDDEIPDLSLKDSTIDSLARVLINEKSIWDAWATSERSDKISEFLESRSLGFFDKEKYPGVEQFYRKPDGSIFFYAMESVGIKHAFTFTGFKD